MNPQITTLSVRASLEEVDMNILPSWDVELEDYEDPELYCDGSDHDIQLNGELNPAFKELLNNIGLFRKLRCVELTHDSVVEVDADTGKIRETTEYRDIFFEKVLLALNHPEHPAEHVHSLSICHLQEATNHDLLTSAVFKAVLSRLDSLELCIAVEEQGWGSEHEIELPGRQVFFGRDLQQYWLAPLQHQLKHLKIYSNCMWGYLPKCDLRGLHFPHLNSLALGNMTFTHDWQLDWIISHGATLEALTLDDCPIIHQAMVRDAQDSERYIHFNDTEGLLWHDKAPAYWIYEARWHDYLHKLNRGLPHLRRFGFDRGPWSFNYGGENAFEPFGTAASLPARLTRSRYGVFHCGILPSQWLEAEDCLHETNYEKITVCEGQYGYELNENPGPPASFPDCWDEDQEALDELLAAVESRRPKDERDGKQSLKKVF